MFNGRLRVAGTIQCNLSETLQQLNVRHPVVQDGLRAAAQQAFKAAFLQYGLDIEPKTMPEFLAPLRVVSGHLYKMGQPVDENSQHGERAVAGGLVAFLPWLRLREPESVASVRFVPVFDKENRLAPELAGAEDPLKRILSSYRDLKGKPITNAVVATLVRRAPRWNLADDDLADVGWATYLLFLAAFATNKYLGRGLESYVNSSAFDLVWQRFSGSPIYVTVSARRRDGGTMDGGYKHGEVVFSCPLQCSLRDHVQVDRDLLASLDRAADANSAAVERLRTALPFFSLGNTDSPTMTELAESILIASALDQLLDADSAHKLGLKFDAVFAPFGSVRVQDVLRVRPGIRLDPQYEAAQRQWWLHRKWIEELYTLRGKASHRGTAKGRNWGWSFPEHLLMAAWVFPLVVKLLLEGEGHHTLADEDRARCTVVDELLGLKDWAEETEAGYGPTVWKLTVSRLREKIMWDQISEKVMEHLKAAKIYPTEADAPENT